MRNYSISFATGGDYLRITVKKEERGYVSQYLFDEIKVGYKIDVAPPCGEFFLETNRNLDKPLVLISAGIGITPLMSMLLSELKTDNQRKIFFVCGKKSRKEHPFADLLEKLTKENSRLETIFFYENIAGTNAKQGFVCLDMVGEYLKDDKINSQFFCGPKDFMLSIHEKLLKNGKYLKALNFNRQLSYQFFYHQKYFLMQAWILTFSGVFV